MTCANKHPVWFGLYVVASFVIFGLGIWSLVEPDTDKSNLQIHFWDPILFGFGIILVLVALWFFCKRSLSTDA